MKKDPLSIKPEAVAKKIVDFVGKTVADAKASGVVVGLSGGVDSALAGALCVRALGKSRVVAVLSPSAHTPRKDIDDAEFLATFWGVETVRVQISPLADALMTAVRVDGSRIARANAQARIRMTILYYVANSRNLLVAGTGDRSEELIGYFTKWGDGGVDFLPIAHLYKTQVRALGKYLELPVRIAEKPASPQLWPRHKATDELPLDYDKLDYVLHGLFDKKLGPKAVAKETGVDEAIVRKIVEMNRKSEHKRSLLPSLV